MKSSLGCTYVNNKLQILFTSSYDWSARRSSCYIFQLLLILMQLDTLIYGHHDVLSGWKIELASLSQMSTGDFVKLSDVLMYRVEMSVAGDDFVNNKAFQ